MKQFITMQSDKPLAIGKRILLCVHQFFPFFSAGTEVLTLSTAQALRAQGHQVEIVTAKLDDIESLERSTYVYKDFTVHQFNIPYAPGKFSRTRMIDEYHNASIYQPFRVLLEQLKPDLVHFFHLKNLTIAALNACFDEKIPTVYTPTDYWISCRSCQLVKPWGKAECTGPNLLAGNCLKHVAINNKKGTTRTLLALTPQLMFSSIALTASTLINTPLKRLVSPLVDLSNRKKVITEALLKVDRILPPTLFIEKLLLQTGLPQSRIQRLRYGIQPPLIHPKEPDLATPTKTTATFGFIGTLTEHKGCHIFMQAIKSLPHVNARFLVYGDKQQYPEYFNTLESIIQEDKRVRFMGTFPHENIGNILSSLDALVIPSTWRENAPLVLLNALACGTPVIASDVTGITEYLGKDDNVAVFEPGNARQLAQRIESRLAMVNDPAHNQSQGRMAGESLDAYVNVLSGVYAELIKSS
ncbi:glycosyltransferase [Pseudomonas tensinigenes]|uniref:Glycosyltransferase n=1 Tax=Pseudomonas tensinigenes TaxID=2745511 RepID=A0ABX8PUF7_9PSED|nr:glycosyltransferase [Pseudomonas tensinigenes]QXI04663.1 glycosyltransferase [Pseudomonas tensinigenes]